MVAAPTRAMQTFFGAQQLGQLVMAVKVLCPGIYGMACIVISTVFYNLLKTHSAADRVGIPLVLQLRGWPAGQLAACVACVGNFRQSRVLPLTSRTHAEAAAHCGT